MGPLGEGKTEERLPLNVGVDIGKIHDPSTVCVCEVSQVDTGRVKYFPNPDMGRHNERGEWIAPKISESVMRTEYTVRFIKRLPLNTSYPDVAIYIANMLDNELFKNRNVRVLIDTTGVGSPVYDSLKSEIMLRLNNARIEQSFQTGLTWKIGKHTLQLKPISFVHGEMYNRSKGTLGKAFLVSRMQSILQERRFHAPDTQEVKAMIDELLVYEIKVSNEGKDTYGAFKTGAHDDLATAAALSCLESPYRDKVSYSERVF